MIAYGIYCRKIKIELFKELVCPTAQHLHRPVPRPCLPGHHKLLFFPSCSTNVEKYAPLSDIVSTEFDRQFVPPT